MRPGLPGFWSSSWAPGITRCSPGNQLRVYAFLDAPQTVNRTLLEQGVGLISTQQKDSNLEDYFLNLIGGRHHG